MNNHSTIIFLAVAAATMLSCTKEIQEASQPTVQMKEFRFNAGFDDSKTVLDGMTVNWDISDIVRVYYKYYDGKDLKTSSSEASIASAEGNKAVFVVSLPQTVLLDTLYSVYNPNSGSPYEWENAGKGTTRARVEFNTVQNAVKGSFDRKAVPMVSRWINSGDDKAVFRYSILSGLLKLEINNQSSFTVDSVVFRNSSDLIGKYYWGYAPGTDSVVTTLSTKNNWVKISGPIDGSGLYYISLPYNKAAYSDISLSFYSGNRVRTMKNPVPLTVNCNKIYTFGRFNVTDSWFQDGSFIVSCPSRSKLDRDTAYVITVTAAAGVEWTATVSGEGASITPASGTGSGKITVSVPANCSPVNDVNYNVTVSTEDGRVEEKSRVRNITLTQARETRVLFGTTWSNSFLTGWKTAGFVASQVYSGEYLSASTEKSIATGDDGNIRGGYSVEFIAGETGKGTLCFDAKRGGANKRVVIYKNGVQVYKDSYEDSELHSYSVGITVTAGDTIRIKPYSSSSNYLYCGANHPIKWIGSPEYATAVTAVYFSDDSLPVLKGRLEYEGLSMTGLSAGFEYIRLTAIKTKSSQEGWSSGEETGLSSEEDDAWKSVDATVSADCSFRSENVLEKGYTYLVRAWAKCVAGDRVYSTTKTVGIN